MRPIDADALINEIKKETEKAIEQDDKVDSFWIGYIAGLVIKQPTIQPVVPDTNVGAKISKFIDGLEEIFADLRERHVDDSVCGLCEYDGAYMGQSGDWCNECPGFDRDDCFKLSDETRKKWTDEIIKALPSAQPERKKGRWLPDNNSVYEMRFVCSCCKESEVVPTIGFTKYKPLWDFCPNCGADMRGEKDG